MLQRPTMDFKREAAQGFMKDVAGDEDFNLAVKGVTESLRSGRGLFLVGECGVGKTHLLWNLYKKIHMFDIRNKWFQCDDADGLLYRLNPQENSDYRELFGVNCFIDDLGTEIKVEYGRRCDYVAQFIRAYHGRGRQRLFISTNLDSDRIGELYDGRILDRIYEMCVVVKFGGSSKRKEVVFS